MILYNIILVRVALYLKKNKQEKQQTLNKVQPSSPLQKKKEKYKQSNKNKIFGIDMVIFRFTFFVHSFYYHSLMDTNKKNYLELSSAFTKFY